MIERFITIKLLIFMASFILCKMTESLFVEILLIAPAEQIIYRNAEVVGYLDKGGVVGFSFAVFVPTYTVLIHVEVESKL